MMCILRAFLRPHCLFCFHHRAPLLLSGPFLFLGLCDFPYPDVSSATSLCSKPGHSPRLRHWLKVLFFFLNCLLFGSPAISCFQSSPISGLKRKKNPSLTSLLAPGLYLQTPPEHFHVYILLLPETHHVYASPPTKCPLSVYMYKQQPVTVHKVRENSILTAIKMIKYLGINLRNG